jgi:methionyl-tRNA formyltransferase
LEQTAVSAFAERNGISLLKPQKPDENLAMQMRSMGCDIILVMAYGHILRKNILEVPLFGIYNFHASILPKYRGASPIEAAIANGESETGVSLMQIVEAMDAGAVADVESVPIAPDDTYADVAKKISLLCPTLLRRNLQKICDGTLKWEEQDAVNATYAGKLSKEEGLLDFSLPAAKLKNRIRALTPHIGCVIYLGGVPLKIGKVAVESADCSRFARGEIVAIARDGMKIATGDGMLIICELQRPGGKMLQAKDFANGFSVKIGEVVPSHPMRELSFVHSH